MKTKMYEENDEMTKFFNYIVMFYGPDRLYSDFFETNPLKTEDIDMAISLYLIMCHVRGVPFCFDTVDREFVRDIMFIIKGMFVPFQVEYSELMTQFFTTDGHFKCKP